MRCHNLIYQEIFVIKIICVLNFCVKHISSLDGSNPIAIINDVNIVLWIKIFFPCHTITHCYTDFQSYLDFHKMRDVLGFCSAGHNYIRHCFHLPESTYVALLFVLLCILVHMFMTRAKNVAKPQPNIN